MNTTNRVLQNKPLVRPDVTSGRALQRKCACGNHAHAGEGECESCHKKREGTLQRAAVNDTAVDQVPSIVHDVLHSSGQPLDESTRAFMEPRFGYDFSNVRVHTGSRAAQSAQSVNALAYTVGRDVVFGEGQYQPTTNVGQKLMAHELTHVVQQSPFLLRKPELGSEQSTQDTSSQRVRNLAALLESYTNRADARLAARNVSAGAIAPIRSNLRELRLGIENLRQVASSGDAKLCSAVLGGFSPARLREASQSLIPAKGQEPVAIAEQIPTSLAAKSLYIDQPYSASEAEADRVASAVVANQHLSISFGTGLGMQRLLDTQAAQQLEANLPAITVAAGATLESATVAAGVIAAGGGPPGWVIGLAILAVVAVVAVGGYLYYKSQQAQPQPQLQPAPQTQTELQPQSRTETNTQPRTRRRREECQRLNPSALICTSPIDLDEVVMNFLLNQGITFDDIVNFDCQGVASFGPGEIDACDGAPGVRHHCRVTIRNQEGGTVSVFGCVCCHEDGTTGIEWRGAHWSTNLSRRSGR